MHKLATGTLYLLAIFIPLTFTLFNSELFEFPKFILLLSGSIILTLLALAEFFQTRRLTLPRFSLLNISLLLFLLTQIIATIFSLHPYTSFWGYYSRFHGGLLTLICYTIIYFSALKWLDKKSTHKLINISIGTAFLVSLYGIAQHFGIDKNLWVQDVQNRVFSTLGQPNWLAAYLIPNLFLVIYFNQINKKIPPIFSYLLFSAMIIALLYTKSRSGLIGFGISYLAYWLLLLRQFRWRQFLSQFISYTSILALIVFLVKTPFAPVTLSSTVSLAPQGTALENGGTESGDIRKIVWTGALDLIKKYPLLGTGPETFAYTYYSTRPTLHNLTSEWDFLYNKAHNEYLNMAAGSGLLGLLAYLFFHFSLFQISLTQIPKSKKINQDQDNQLRYLYPVIGASIVGYTITSFFGFAVIPVYFILILIAFIPTTITQKPSPSAPAPLALYLVIALALIYPARIFYADYLYQKGKTNSSLPLLQKALGIRPELDLLHAQIGELYAQLGQKNLALKELELNKKLNPHHLNFYKSRTKIYLALAAQEPSYYTQAAEELVVARSLAPTDPKLAYNLALIYTRLDDEKNAEIQLKDAITLKPNYPEPYYALTLLYEQTKQTDQIPPLLTQAQSNLATYSALLREKIDKYTNLQH